MQAAEHGSTGSSNSNNGNREDGNESSNIRKEHVEAVDRIRQEMMASIAKASKQEKEVKQNQGKGEENEEESSSSSGSSSSDSDSDSGSGSSSSTSKNSRKESKKTAASAKAGAGATGLPIAEVMILDKQHTHAVSCCAFHPNGAKMITGSYDCSVRIYDFGGMTIASRSSYKKIVPLEGSVLVSTGFNSSGTLFVAATSNAKLRFFNFQQCALELVSCQGDPYILDMAKTKGHVTAVTGACWDPRKENIMLSSSLDGTCRFWDVNADTSRNLGGELNCVEIFKAKSVRNTRVGVQTCQLGGADGSIICGACSDGSIQIWKRNGSKIKPELIAREGAHADGSDISAVAFSPQNEHLLASRGSDGTLVLWDLRRFTHGPVKRCTSLEHVHPQTGAIFSLDGRCILACGTTSIASSGFPISGDKGSVHVFDVLKDDSAEWVPIRSIPIQISGSTQESATQARQVQSTVGIAWSSRLNQIAVGCTDGHVAVFFDESISKNGAKLIGKTGSKKRERIETFTAYNLAENEKEAQMIAAKSSVILNIGSLPMYKSSVQEAAYEGGLPGSSDQMKKRMLKEVRMDKKKSQAPPRPGE